MNVGMAASADPTLKKIVNVMGPDRAWRIINETLDRIGCDALHTPDDRYRFAVELMKRGGILEAIGRAAKIQAILLGAKEV
jgi:hypothetical protein